MTPRLRSLAAAVCFAFLVIHLSALPRTLEDVDSINFALGVEHFDVAAHRPHPPGYPVFVGLAKASTRALGVVVPQWDRDHRAAAGLAIWSVLSGALAVFVFADFWIAIGLIPWLALLAAIVAVASPLFWLTASRPLTDMPGLVVAVLVQTWFIRGLRAMRDGAKKLPVDWLWAAGGAGFIIGLRSQSVWLTGPLFAWAIGELLSRRRSREAAHMLAAAAAGVLLWALPLVWESGGIGHYIAAVRYQGTTDLANIELLATTPTWKLLIVALRRTFLDPWQVPVLAKAVIALAAIGGARLAWQGRRVLAVAGVCFWPYLVFHLTFQETITTRYGLPLIVPAAGFAVIGLSVFGKRLAPIGASVIALISLVVVQPRLMAYAKDGAPLFRVFQDMQHARLTAPDPPLVRMHHQVWWGLQRVMDWYRPYWDVGAQPFPGDHEWLSVVQHFKSGDQRPVWFLAYLSRHDLSAFDPRSTHLTARYELSTPLRTLIGGTRLDSLNWWSIAQPGWMVGRGWALTPELAGLTSGDQSGPERHPAEAYLRRDREPLRVLIGGRYLGPETGPPTVVSATLDGRELAHWTITGHPRWFVQWIDLPAGVPDGPDAYATLAVRAVPDVAHGGASVSAVGPAVGLEQFDAAPVDQPIAAFVDGWNEREADPATGVQWMWTTGRSTLQVKGADGDRVLVIAGESSLKYFAAAPQVVVRAGETVLSMFVPTTDFTQAITVPAAALRAANGVITIETSETFRPSDAGGLDTRTLGLKLYSVAVK